MSALQVALLCLQMMFGIGSTDANTSTAAGHQQGLIVVQDQSVMQ